MDLTPLLTKEWLKTQFDYNDIAIEKMENTIKVTMTFNGDNMLMLTYNPKKLQYNNIACSVICTAFNKRKLLGSQIDNIYTIAVMYKEYLKKCEQKK